MKFVVQPNLLVQEFCFITSSIKIIEFLSDTCYSYKKVCTTPVSELKPQPGMLIIVNSDCYLEQQNEHTGKNLYGHESKVKKKNYFKC